MSHYVSDTLAWSFIWGVTGAVVGYVTAHVEMKLKGRNRR